MCNTMDDNRDPLTLLKNLSDQDKEALKKTTQSIQNKQNKQFRTVLLAVLIIGIIVGAIDLGIKVYFEYTMSPDEIGKDYWHQGFNWEKRELEDRQRMKHYGEYEEGWKDKQADRTGVILITVLGIATVLFIIKASVKSKRKKAMQERNSAGPSTTRLKKDAGAISPDMEDMKGTRHK